MLLLILRVFGEVLISAHIARWMKNRTHRAGPHTHRSLDGDCGD